MKTVKLSDVSLKQIAARKEEMPLCERGRVISSLVGIGVDAIELPAIDLSAENAIVNRIAAKQAQGCEVRIPVGYTVSSVCKTAESVMGVSHICLQVEYPLSTVQLEYRFHQKAAQAIDTVRQLLESAKNACEKVELIAGDATRTERDLLLQICALAEECGVSILTLCDDTETALPHEIAEIIRFIRPCWKGTLSFCASNRFGMGIASAMAAIEAGADEVKVSVWGENAVPIADFARLLHAREEGLGFSTGLNVTTASNIVDGLLHRDPISLESAIREDTNAIVLNSSSTLADVQQAVGVLGYDLSDEDCGKVHEELQRVVAQKGSIGTKEFEAIIASAAMAVPSTYHVETYVINSGNSIYSTAQIVLSNQGEQFCGVSMGDGPIDAAFHAIEQIIGHHYELEDFQIQAVTHGREALGSALVKLRSEGRLYSGNGVSTDIVGASIRAYVNALNKIVFEEN